MTINKWVRRSSTRFISDQFFVTSWEISFCDWFENLTDDQENELATLDESWQEFGGMINKPAEGVMKDWIEDHGGNRGWWHAFRIYKI